MTSRMLSYGDNTLIDILIIFIVWFKVALYVIGILTLN